MTAFKILTTDSAAREVVADRFVIVDRIWAVFMTGPEEVFRIHTGYLVSIEKKPEQ